jgi:hypothetical protein
MRVLRRNSEADEARQEDAEAEAADARAEAAEAKAEADDAEARASDRRTIFPAWRRSGAAVDEQPAPAAATTTTVDDDTARPGDEPTEPMDRPTPRAVQTESEVHVELWSWADAVVAVVGAALALVGLIALARAGIDRTWYRPVVEVLDADHTAALGAAEVGAGLLFMLAGIARSRAAAAFLGLATAIIGALAAIETAEVRRELAIEQWWAWGLAGVGLLVAVVALVPPRRSRVERVLETR